MADLPHHPHVLFDASVERLAAARHAARASDWVMTAYLAGLAVECLLQAFALRAGAAHDISHALGAWLKRCPSLFRDAIIRKAQSDWSAVVAVWRNNLRYQSEAGFLGYLRRENRFRRIRDGGPAIIKYAAQELLEAADRIHAIGAMQWPSLSTKVRSILRDEFRALEDRFYPPVDEGHLIGIVVSPDFAQMDHEERMDRMFTALKRSLTPSEFRRIGPIAALTPSEAETLDDPLPTRRNGARARRPAKRAHSA